MSKRGSGILILTTREKKLSWVIWLVHFFPIADKYTKHMPREGDFVDLRNAS